MDPCCQWMPQPIFTLTNRATADAWHTNGSIIMNPWDVRPKAVKGNQTPDSIFLAVGVALTAWERLESMLAELFDLLLASENRAAFKVYQSSKTSNARREMLSAALPLDRASERENAELTNFVSSVNEFAARRNEIAHGQIYALGEHGYYLGPSNLTKRKWGKEGAAKYQYVASDIDYYTREFGALERRCGALIGELKSAAKT
jgi:hypothetical protein